MLERSSRMWRKGRLTARTQCREKASYCLSLWCMDRPPRLQLSDHNWWMSRSGKFYIYVWKTRITYSKQTEWPTTELPLVPSTPLPTVKEKPDQSSSILIASKGSFFNDAVDICKLKILQMSTPELFPESIKKLGRGGREFSPKMTSIQDVDEWSLYRLNG